LAGQAKDYMRFVVWVKNHTWWQKRHESAESRVRLAGGKEGRLRRDLTRPTQGSCGGGRTVTRYRDTLSRRAPSGYNSALRTLTIPLYEAEARKRMLAAQNNDAGRAVMANLPEQDGGRARDHAAWLVALHSCLLW
jgi:hypothetical protein